MASIVMYSGGLRRVEFSLSPRGVRKAVRLGRVSLKIAETWKARIETILADRLANRPHDPETARWLGGLDELMLGRLREAGLADGEGLAHTTLGQFLQRCFSSFCGKDATRTFYGHTRRNLEEYFGAGRVLRTITAADADGFRAWLANHLEPAEHGLSREKRLAPATVARRIIASRTIWRKAIRWKLAAENPFTGIKARHQENDSRKEFIRRDVIDEVMAEAPDTEWRVIIALSRYGALRCPSEHFRLRWGDIDWQKKRMLVRSPKTEHHEGKATRIAHASAGRDEPPPAVRADHHPRRSCALAAPLPEPAGQPRNGVDAGLRPGNRLPLDRQQSGRGRQTLRHVPGSGRRLPAGGGTGSERGRTPDGGAAK